jgi:peptide deformylase
MIRLLRFYGDPVLREKAAPFDVVTEEVRKLAADMLETMRAERGVGLAAQQIGLSQSICVIDVPPDFDLDEAGVRQHPDQPMPLVLINPEIVSSSEEVWSAEEGCLSFPDINGQIKRPFTITLRYTSLDGETIENFFQGFLARVIQHEVDHLNGVLFIDRMSPVKRAALSGRLKRMRKENRMALGLPV